MGGCRDGVWLCRPVASVEVEGGESAKERDGREGREGRRVEAHLGDSSTPNRLLVELLEDFIERSLEDAFDDLLGVMERVRFPVGMKLTESFAESMREQIRSGSSPLSELRRRRARKNIESANDDTYIPPLGGGGKSKAVVRTDLNKTRTSSLHLPNQNSVPPDRSSSFSLLAILQPLPPPDPHDWYEEDDGYEESCEMEESSDGHDGFYHEFHHDETDDSEPSSLLFDGGAEPGPAVALGLVRNGLGGIPVVLLSGFVGEGRRSVVLVREVVAQERGPGDASEGEVDFVDPERFLLEDLAEGRRSEEFLRERGSSAREGIRRVGSSLLVEGGGREETDGRERGGRRREAEEGDAAEEAPAAGRGKKGSARPSSEEEREGERRGHD